MEMEEKKVKVFTNEKKKEEKVVMPQDYKNAEFDKAQLKQLLIEAGMDARSAAGQSTCLYKIQASAWSTNSLIAHYSMSKSKVKEQILNLLGASGEQIREARIKKGNDNSSLIDNIKLGFAMFPEIAESLKSGEDAGIPLWDRINSSQRSKLLNVNGGQLTEGELKCLLISGVSKYGLAAAFGEEYISISLQDAYQIIKKKKG